jgi:outer membrane protein assembly factor BamB
VDVILSAPAIGIDGTLYFATAFQLYVIKPDGTGMRSLGATELGCSPAIGYGGTIYVWNQAMPSDPMLPPTFTFCALKPDGSIKWRIPHLHSIFTGYTFSAAVGADGTIYAGASDGKVY